jgi:hypothetical protein
MFQNKGLPCTWEPYHRTHIMTNIYKIVEWVAETANFMSKWVLVLAEKKQSLGSSHLS